MTKTVNHVSHIKSKQKINGKPQLPLPSVLIEGEIAVNYAENVETLSIKNESGSVITFSSDNYYTEQKLGSGFTGANSANTVTDVIEKNEKTISSSLNDLNQRKLDASEMDNYYTKDETSGKTEISTALGGKVNTATFTAHTASSVHMSSTEKTNLDSLATNIGAISGISSTKVSNWDTAYTNNHTHSNKAILDGITASAAAINSLTGTVGTMAFQNTSSYSSATQVNTAMGAFADSVKYNSNSKYVEFYHGGTGGTKVFEYDASPFLIDGMVDNVEVKDVTSGSSTVPCLVISFNTAAGKQDINIPISKIFDPNLYYTKTDVVSAITSANSGSVAPVSVGAVMNVIKDNELVVASSLNELNERKADISGVTDVSDTLSSHTANTSIHLTSTEKTNLDSLATNISAISGITSTKVSNWDATYNDHVSTSRTITTASGLTGGGDLSANRTIGLAATGTAGTYKQVVVDVYGRVTSGNSADNNTWRSIKVNGTNFLTDTSTALNLSGGSNVTLTTGSTGLITINTEVVSAITAENKDSLAPVSVKVLVDDELAISSALNDLNETISGISDSISGISDSINEKLGSGFTTSSVTQVIEANEETFVAAITDLEANKADKAAVGSLANDINDLRADKLDATAYTPTDLSNYYTKSETSGKSEISTALNGKANTNHNQASNTITAMTNYVMAESGTAITTADTLNQAIGKVEKQHYEIVDFIEQKELVIAASLNDLNDRTETIRVVDVSSNLTNQTTNIQSGQRETVIYKNTSTTTDYVIAVNTSIKNNYGDIIEITCPRNGYCEISYINVDGTIFARAL